MELLAVELFSSRCLPNSASVNARLVFGEDLTAFMPYLNASQPRARYYPDVPHVKFMWEGRWVVVERTTASGMGFESEEAAREGAGRLAEHLQAVAERKGSIAPDPTPYRTPSLTETLKRLPRAGGCSDCGYPSCMAFAAAVTRDEAELGACPRVTPA